MREVELMETLKLILDKLNSGRIPITEEMVRRAQANGVLPKGGMHTTHISSQTGMTIYSIFYAFANTVCNAVN